VRTQPLLNETSQTLLPPLTAVNSDFFRTLVSRNIVATAADLKYGVEAEFEEFTGRLLILQIDTIEETHMSDTKNNGLSTSP
jgi:hypothetical protein